MPGQLLFVAVWSLLKKTAFLSSYTVMVAAALDSEMTRDKFWPSFSKQLHQASSSRRIWTLASLRLLCLRFHRVWYRMTITTEMGTK